MFVLFYLDLTLCQQFFSHIGIPDSSLMQFDGGRPLILPLAIRAGQDK
jgi:hypothetical protein